MNTLIVKMLGWATRSATAQRLLELNVSVSHALMGIGSTTALGSEAERRVFSTFVSAVLPSVEPVIFDVGANVGQYARMVISQMNPRPFQLHCFEPSRDSFSELQRNLSVRKNVHLNCQALGKAEGCGVLYSDSAASGCASLTKPSGSNTFSLKQAVTVDTLDNYCRVNAIRRVDWLKIDVEGHEIDVLRGAQEMCHAAAIRNIYFEFGFPAIESRVFLRDFFEFCNDYGMKMHRVTLGGTLVCLKTYRGSYEQFRAASSFLAKPAMPVAE